MELKVDDLVMCSVKKIEGTTVFLAIEGDGDASMSMSEVAAGRIRNLRDYVSVNKKIVCKVLKIINGNPQMSLRRVTAHEREEILERFTKERTFTALIKAVIKDYEQIVLKIKEKYEFWKFYDEARENPELLKEFLGTEDAQKLSKLLLEKREKEKIAKREFVIKSTNEEGIYEIKDLLNQKGVDIRYLGSSRFSIIGEGKDFREANSKVEKALNLIGQKAKEKKVLFEITEQKS